MAKKSRKKVKFIKNQAQILSELLVNISSGYFGYVLLSSYSNLGSLLIIQSIFFGLMFYYLAVRIRNEYGF